MNSPSRTRRKGGNSDSCCESIDTMGNLDAPVGEGIEITPAGADIDSCTVFFSPIDSNESMY